MKTLFEALKARLRENQSNYLEHHSMLGSTEGGFYSEDVFDINMLMKEIDDFAAEFEAKRLSNERKGD